MLEVMFESPSAEKMSRVVVNREIVEGLRPATIEVIEEKPVAKESKKTAA